jgi:hypothetical protein
MVELRTYRPRRQSRSVGRETSPLELTVCRSISEIGILGVRGEGGMLKSDGEMESRVTCSEGRGKLSQARAGAAAVLGGDEAKCGVKWNRHYQKRGPRVRVQ